MDIAGASIHGSGRRPLFPEYPGVELTEADVMAEGNMFKTLRQIAREKYEEMNR